MARHVPTSIRRRDVLGVLGAGTLTAAMPRRGWAQAPAVAGLKLGFIGAGREGGALGTVFAKAGHPVMFSSRHPETLSDLVAGAGPNAKAGTVEEAVKFADAIFLVVPFTAVEQIGKDFGAAIAAKKLLVDVSNPIPRRDGEDFVKQVNELGGAGVATAKFIPGAKLVRAFNNFGSANLSANANQPDKNGVPIAGDDKGAIALAEGLIREIGFAPVLIGGLAMGKYVIPSPPLGGVHSADEIKQIAATLKS
jgi:8-hydroxy-5-deazaflavin:NADPH oxidoreductase